MTEEEFILNDRLAKIQAMDKLHNLQENSYISFSGGRDSTVLHYLIDEALPKNKIPRVYINTGIEYQKVLQFVKELALQDERIIIYNSGVNIKAMLNEKGYPFKSKEHSEKLSIFQNSGKTDYIKTYLGEKPGHTNPKYMCPDRLRYQFTPEFKIKISKRCCNELKKKPAAKYAKENNKTIVLTGMRTAEGGTRSNISCAVMKEGKLAKFHPLAPISDAWLNWYAERQKIKFSELYYPPYNFTRTGCKGCPFAPDLQKELDVMKFLLPTEYKACNALWDPVYTEYRRLGYRLKDNTQPELF